MYLAIAFRAQADTNLIGVAAVTGPPSSIEFYHLVGHGYKGHVIGTAMDEIHWFCLLKKDCALTITPKAASFCSETMPIMGTGTATCTITGGAGIQDYTYQITVDGVTSPDPYVIVDNGRGLGGSNGKKPDKDKKPDKGKKK